MAFIRARTIKGKKYLYLEYRYRRDKKVMSKSVFLGVLLPMIAVAHTIRKATDPEYAKEHPTMFGAHRRTTRRPREVSREEHIAYVLGAKERERKKAELLEEFHALNERLKTAHAVGSGRVLESTVPSTIPQNQNESGEPDHPDGQSADDEPS